MQSVCTPQFFVSLLHVWFLKWNLRRVHDLRQGQKSHRRTLHHRT